MSHHRKCCCRENRCCDRNRRCNRRRDNCGGFGGLGNCGCGSLWPLIFLFGCCGNRRDC